MLTYRKSKTLSLSSTISPSKHKSKTRKQNIFHNSNKTHFDPIQFSHRLLFNEYNCTKEGYEILIVNNLLHNKPCHIVSVFKENMIQDYIDEFLKRIYRLDESKERVPKYAKFYRNFLLLFCKPTICDLELNEIIKKHSEEKAEEYYRKKFPEDNLDNSEEEIERSEELSSTIKEENKTIFTSTLKNSIDNNTMITNSPLTNTNNDMTLTLRDTERFESVNGYKGKDTNVITTEENTLISILDNMNNKQKKKNKNISKNIQQPISAMTRRKIQQIIQKGYLQSTKIQSHNNNANLHNLIKMNLKKSTTVSSQKKKTYYPKSKSKSKSKPKTLPKPPQASLATLNPKSRNSKTKNSLNSRYKTVDFNLTNSTAKFNFTRTQNVEGLINKYSLSKSKQLNSSSKKRLATEVSTSYKVTSSWKHIKPVIKIKKSTSNIKLITSYNTNKKMTNSNTTSNNKNDLMKIALSLLLDNSHKRLHQHTNTNINININNQININTSKSNNVNINFNNQLNEKLNKKIRSNDNVAMNIKSNLNHLSRNSTNTLSNGRIITSYHNKSISSLSSLLVKKRTGLGSKSKSTNKK